MPNARRFLSLLGIALLIAWAIWWWLSIRDGRLLFGERTWVPAFDALGLDFLHNYLAVEHFRGGGNPWIENFGDPAAIFYNYAPVVLLLFAWTAAVPLVPAVVMWDAAIAAIMGLAAWQATRVRARLGERSLPAVFAIAAVLLSSGVVFAMERGNCDALVVLLIVIAAAALYRRSTPSDILAGAALALAAWVKVYPVVTIFGLLALRRGRAFLAAAIVGLLIGLATPTYTAQWLHNIRVDAARYTPHYGDALYEAHRNDTFITHAHSISGFWVFIFDRPVVRPLARLSPEFGTGMLILPLIVWVSLSLRAADANRRTQLIFPYLLWLTQAATFASPVSFDYKLLFLPLAIVSLWDRRDRWLAHAMLLPYLLYWQPLRIEFLTAFPLLGIKFAALVGCAVLLVDRTKTRTMATAKLKLLPIAEYTGVNRNDPIRYYRWPIFGKLYQRRVELCLSELKGGHRVLEVGFGTGVSFLNLREIYQEIHGIDLTADVEPIASLWRRHGVETHLRVGSVLEMPYPDDHFDAVLLVSILEHLKPHEQPIAMKEIRRVLKPGGQMVYGVPVERPLMVFLFRLLGHNIRDEHFSTEKDVSKAAGEAMREASVKQMMGTPSFTGAVYEVGHFTKA